MFFLELRKLRNVFFLIFKFNFNFLFLLFLFFLYRFVLLIFYFTFFPSFSYLSIFFISIHFRFLSLASFIAFSFGWRAMWIDSTGGINRLYLEPWSITMRFCSIMLSKPSLYLHFTTTMILHSLSRIFFPSRVIAFCAILTHYERLHSVIRSFTIPRNLYIAASF